MNLPAIDHVVSIIGGLTALVLALAALRDRWRHNRPTGDAGDAHVEPPRDRAAGRL